MPSQVELPIYRQMHNTCGISTFLMLINPEKNQKFKIFLDRLYENINLLMRSNQNEFKWSIAITYLLLKSMGSNLIRQYLYKKNPDIVDYYMPIVYYKIGDNKFYDTNKITKRILKSHLHTMREDPDFKMLFNLFGGDFYPQEQDIWDGTGALYFIRNDFRQDGLNSKKKIKILEDHLNTQMDGKNSCMALNLGFHWVAVNSIENGSLQIHNSLSRSPNIIKITEFIPESYRFYLFSYHEKDAFILKREVLEFLEIDL